MCHVVSISSQVTAYKGTAVIFSVNLIVKKLVFHIIARAEIYHTFSKKKTVLFLIYLTVSACHIKVKQYGEVTSVEHDDNVT